MRKRRKKMNRTSVQRRIWLKRSLRYIALKSSTAMCNCSLVSVQILHVISSPVPLSFLSLLLSLFVWFFIHPKRTFTRISLFLFFSLRFLFLRCSYSLTILFFSHTKNWWSIVYSIVFVQISAKEQNQPDWVREKMRERKAKAKASKQTHRQGETHKRIAHTTNRTAASQQQITALEKNTNNNKDDERREDTDTLLPLAADSFLVYGLLNEITNSVSVWFRALSR